MYGSELTCYSFWWIVPILLMIMCFFIMRSRRGSMICGFGSRDIDNYQTKGSDTTIQVLDKRYASGEINKDEYQEIKMELTDSPSSIYE